MLVGGVRDTGGSRSGTDRQGGAGVRMTGQGWVRDGEARPEVGQKLPDQTEGTPNCQGVMLVMVMVMVMVFCL